MHIFKKSYNKVIAKKQLIISLNRIFMTLSCRGNQRGQKIYGDQRKKTYFLSILFFAKLCYKFFTERDK